MVEKAGDAAPPPAVSVIIPVRNRRDLLLETLAALDAQTFRDFEVIVADDGSSDGSREAAASAVVAGQKVHVIIGPGRGAMPARKAACEVAQGRLLAFTDSDCTPSPGWLAALVAAADAGADLITGPTLATRRVKPLERSMTSTGADLGYATCNVMYRREMYERAGGFVVPPESPLTGIAPTGSLDGEDTLMGWRLRRLGAVPAVAPDAVVYHHVFPPDMRELLRRTWSLHLYATVVDLVPEMAESHLRLHLIRLCRERGLLPLITLSAVTGRRRIGLALIVVWVALRARTRRQEGASAVEILHALPIEFVVDAVRMVAVLRGQVRTRRLVI